MNISQRLRTCAKHTGLDAVIELLQEAADEIDALQARAQVQGDPSWWRRETDEGAEWTDTAPLVLSGWTPLYITPQPAQAAQAEAQQPDNAACGSVQKRHQAQQPATGEPVYWEWRHLSTHPDTVDFGKWSEWKRVEARSAIHTIEDALAEFRAYIAQGYKYELRALYDHPAPSVPDEKPLPDLMMASYHEAIGWNACRAAMLAAK